MALKVDVYVFSISVYILFGSTYGNSHVGEFEFRQFRVFYCWLQTITMIEFLYCVLCERHASQDQEDHAVVTFETGTSIRLQFACMPLF